MTLAWCASMSAMPGMSMPGGWTLSMVWMRMPGRTWLASVAWFLCMWVVMMLAMMLPSLVPKLLRYRRAIGSIGKMRARLCTTVVGAAYFLVWAVLAIPVYAMGITTAAIELHEPSVARAVPIAGGVVVLIAGLLQFTAWKARRLACCRESSACSTPPAHAGAALRNGVRLGIDCSQCCLGFIAILSTIGIMDLRAMILVTVAITLERVAPSGARIARATGALAAAMGLFLIVRAGGIV